jgi:hypothetical protein
MYADHPRNASPIIGRVLRNVALVLGVACLPSAALAYIGPGAGLSIVGSIVAVLGTIVVAIVGFVWYPIRRMLKKRRAAAAKAEMKNTTSLPSEQG